MFTELPFGMPGSVPEVAQRSYAFFLGREAKIIDMKT